MRRRSPWYRHLGTQSLIALAAVLCNGASAELSLNNASVNQLENGLTVILLEDRNFPVASVQMLYRVGARNEVTGKTGLAHFVEHMAFRESENFPDTGVVSSIYARGGEWHGYTWTDETTYFATVPVQHLDLLLRIEADRMTRLIIAEDKIEPERGAVLAEMHMYENDPSSMLTDAVLFASFLAHPYRNNTIGWESDVRNIARQDVVGFYEEHYHPSNGVLVVVGDINGEQTLARIEELFGGFERKVQTTLPVTKEPLQTGERRIRLSGTSDSRLFKIAYRAPSANHPDFAVFLVLQELLGGGSGTSFLQNDWGTPVRSGSLLAGAANHLTTWFPPSAQDYAFVIGGSARDEISESVTEQAIENRVKMIRDKVTDSSTLSAAISRVKQELIFDIETTEDAAHQLAFFEGLHALNVLLTLPQRIDAVTSADVQRVARVWLLPQRKTVAWYVPGEIAETGAEPLILIAPEFDTPVGNPAVDDRPIPAPVARILRGGTPAIVQQSDLSSSVHVQIVLFGNNIVASNATAGSPAWGFTSTELRRSSKDLASAIDESLASLTGATIDKSRAAASSTNPETRLEQVFEQHMGTMSADEVTPALIVVSGDVDVDNTFTLLERKFGDVNSKPATATKTVAISHGELTVNLGRPIAQAQLGYIVLAPGPGEAGYSAARILQYIFSHGYEGRFGTAAISDQGLAYYVDSRYRSAGANGWISLAIGVDAQKLNRLKSLLFAEFRRLISDPPTLAEFEEAKAHLLGRAISAAQSNEELASALATQWLWHGNLPNNETLQSSLESVNYSELLATVPAFINGLTIVVAE